MTEEQKKIKGIMVTDNGYFGKKEDFRYEIGDRVFHKNLGMHGTFVEYDWTGNSECHVDFDNEDGFEDCRHVSTNQLILVERKNK